MAREKPKIITANRLDDGVVVYLDKSGNSSERLEDSKVAMNKDEEDVLMETASHAERDLLIIAPYSMDIELTGSNLAPRSQRERIRSSGGPTIKWGGGSNV